MHPSSLRGRLSLYCQAGIEGVVLALVVLSPWLFGAVEPLFEWLLMAGVALIACLWAARLVLDGGPNWIPCPATWCLIALIGVGLWQLVPMPPKVLAVVAPGTERLYRELLPRQSEELPFGETRDMVKPAPGSTISLYPSATRQELLRLLGALMLFAAVRTSIRSAAALRRLALACVVNGVLLSLLGMMQFFSSPHHLLYWRFPSSGQVFGPFICRNHFPFYINVCIGLGLGLLFDRKRDRPDASAPSGPWYAGILTLLHRPGALWICLSLAVMGSAVLLTLSRGGLAALCLGGLIVLLLGSRRARESISFVALCVPLVLGLAIVGWLGMGFVEARVGTLWQGKALLESRIPLWTRNWSLVHEFFPLGTGYGSYPLVEPLTRQGASAVDVVYEHAHNDFLEALIEGGPVRLVLCLCLIGWVFWQGIRAVRHGRHAGLALGALAGFTTVVVHSFGDFGLHIPAIAVLATVLSAHLCNRGDTTRVAARRLGYAVRGERVSRRWFGAGPILGGAIAIGLGLVLVLDGWRAERVHRLRMAAFHGEATRDDAHLRHRIDLLETAARLAPHYARLQFEVGQVHADLYRYQAELAKSEQVSREAGRAVLGAAAVPGLGAASWPITWHAVTRAEAEQQGERDAERVREHLVPALRHWLRARDDGPLMSQPHVRLAEYRNQLAQAEPRSAYLQRGKRLLPYDPEFWFFCGVQELMDNDTAACCSSWRQCLVLSDARLREILALSQGRLSPADIAERLLPERADRLVAAADRLFPEPNSEERRPLLEKALALLDNSKRAMPAEEQHLRAVIQLRLGYDAGAEEDLRNALALKPHDPAWRLELAQLLHHRHKPAEARQELLIVLAQQPSLTEARQLLDQVEHTSPRRP